MGRKDSHSPLIAGSGPNDPWEAVMTLLLLLLAAATPAPADSNPVFGTVGYVRPVLQDPGCIVAGLRRTVGPPYDHVVRVKFAVLADGTMGPIEPYGDVPPAVVRGIQRAAEDCRFKPGTRADGTPVAMWMVLPIRYQRLATEVRSAADYGALFGAPGGMGSLTETADATPQVSTHVSTREEAGEPEPGCIARAFKAPRGLTERLEFDFRFVVSANGGASDFRFPPQATAEIRDQLVQAVGQCPVMPGLGSNGLPNFGVVSVSIRYAPPFASELERNPRLQHGAQLLDPGCVSGALQALGPGLAATALLRVSGDGVPSDVTIEPKDLPVVEQSTIIDALRRCKWKAAVGADGQAVAAWTTVAVQAR